MAKQKTTEASPSESTGTFYDGSESFFGTFMQAQISLNAIRLTLDEQIAYSVFDLAADVETARRVFLHTGNIVTALHDVRRVENQFEMRVQSWDTDVAERARNKRGMSGAAIAKMKAEVARVRAKINLTRRTITKLRIELHHLGHQDDDADVTSVKRQQPPENPGLVELMQESITARILHDFIGSGLRLGYFEAKRMIVGQFGAREIAWDGELATLVAGWYPCHRIKSQKDRFTIKIWLCPKSPEIRDRLFQEHAKLRLSIACAGSLPVDLKWHRAEEPSDFPQSHSLLPFLDRIDEKRFRPAGQPFHLMCATVNESFWKNSSLELIFRVVG